jgi:uncharacterized protein (TIGR03382 family)
MALASALSATTQAVVIDSFSSVAVDDDGDSFWPLMQHELGSVTVVETGLTGVLGGVRNTTATFSSATFPGIDFIQTAIVPEFGVILDYAASAGADGELALLYDGGGSLDIDFSQELSIELEFADFDFAFGAPMPVTITLNDGTNSASLTKSLNSAGPHDLSFALNEFAGIGGLNLASLSSITVGIDPGTAADYRLTNISTVTIPAPGALVLLAAGALTGLRRRRH